MPGFLGSVFAFPPRARSHPRLLPTVPCLSARPAPLVPLLVSQTRLLQAPSPSTCGDRGAEVCRCFQARSEKGPAVLISTHRFLHSPHRRSPEHRPLPAAPQTRAVSSQAPCPPSPAISWKSLEATLWLSPRPPNVLSYLGAWDFLQCRPHISATTVHLTHLEEPRPVT